MKFSGLGAIPLILIALAVCGCTDEKLSGGAYRLAQVSFSQDECNIKENLPEGHEIELTVKDSTVTVYMAKDLTPPKGAILGDSFMAVASKDGDLIPGTDCRDMWLKKLTGKLVQKNVFAGTYEFTEKALSGSDCADEEKIGFHPPICASTVTFTATKK